MKKSQKIKQEQKVLQKVIVNVGKEERKKRRRKRRRRTREPPQKQQQKQTFTQPVIRPQLTYPPGFLDNDRIGLLNTYYGTSYRQPSRIPLRREAQERQQNQNNFLKQGNREPLPQTLRPPRREIALQTEPEPAEEKEELQMEQLEEPEELQAEEGGIEEQPSLRMTKEEAIRIAKNELNKKYITKKVKERADEIMRQYNRD